MPLGRRPGGVWSAQDLVQPLCPLGGQGRVGRCVPCLGRGGRAAGRGADGQLGGEGAPLGLRRKRGERTQAVGRSRGGRTTKIHALTDAACRPLAFILTRGNDADCVAAEALLTRLPVTRIVHGDKGYDSDRLRRRIEQTGAAPNIPPKSNRLWKPCFSPALYRGRNAIERMFGRLKDFRRIATRYDKLATNFLAAIQLVATVCYWL